MGDCCGDHEGQHRTQQQPTAKQDRTTTVGTDQMHGREHCEKTHDTNETSKIKGQILRAQWPPHNGCWAPQHGESGT